MEQARPSFNNVSFPFVTPEIVAFSNFEDFSKAVQEVTGNQLDLVSVTEIQTHFIQSTDQYLILNIKDFDPEDPNNMMFLTADKAFIYSKHQPAPEEYKPFEKVCQRAYGKTTVLAFLTFNKALDNYKARLEKLIDYTRDLEQHFESKKYRDLNFEFERLNDRLDEFRDLLLRLQQRGYREIETRYISFDYDVLLTEATSLQGRCDRRANLLKEIGRDHELQVTVELNRRMEKLNDVVKRLTAITVILMLPTLIASHFGMNFVYMPELKIPWAYPTVIGFQVLITIAGIILFRKIGWL